MNFAELRSLFPALERTTYFNSARCGLGFAAQGEAAARFYVDKAGGIANNVRWIGVAEDVACRLAALIKVKAAEIGFLSSTTEALNLLAGSIPLGPDDEVVVPADEYPSVILPWERHGRGAAVRRVAIDDEERRTDLLCEAIRSTTRILCVSHVHNRTGTMVDLDRLADACDEHDTLLIVDGVQAVGSISVDASRTDAYCLSVYKWLMSGYGLGFVRVSPRLADRLDPLFRGYFNPAPSQKLRYGTLDFPGLYALQASLMLSEQFGWDRQFDRIAQLARLLTEELAAAGHHATGRGAQTGIVSVPHPNPVAAVAESERLGLNIEPWDSGLIRLSPHYYNDERDVHKAVEIVKRVMQDNR